jgi:Reverse transcriptase (RNA-dependent DNA polymerase)
VRIVLALAYAKQWVVHQLDVKSAFLNGFIEEDIYMKLPPEYARADGKVCKLNRSIYGLRQAPRAWNKRLCDDLRGCGFSSLVNAESVFRGAMAGAVVYLLIYVDDILVVSASIQAAVLAKKSLGALYTVKDLGEVEYFLGVKVERERGRLNLSQESYIHSVLERYGMQDCKPVLTPMVQSSDLMATSQRSEIEASRMVGVPFREAIGSLLYLAIRTRPDISVAVSILSKHVQEPKPSHWEGVKRILRYLKGTASLGLRYESTGPNPALKIYCDADWATDPDDRRSRSGVVCYLGNSLVAWKSRRQATPSVSSCEAEYIALFEAGRDAVWMRSLLCELDMCPGKAPTTILHDNQGSIAWAQGGLRKIKHVELKYHHTQYLIESEQIRIEYVESSKNAADVMTKALCGPSFQQALNMLGIA